MSKNKPNFLSSLFCLVLGIILGFGAITYFKLPLTEAVTVTEETYYTKSAPQISTTIPINEANISVHFLELGNKYTGDCTYIKTDTCDILIDCGSRATSVPYVSNYLNQYVTDGILEYVIVTHAHQDHYAGFATSEKVDSIFDLYACQNIITFSNTNQNKDLTKKTLYSNFMRELNEELNTQEDFLTTPLQKHWFEAKDCITGENGAQQTFDIGTNITLTVLDNTFYTEYSPKENNYSVCTLITYNQSAEKEYNMLFTGDLEDDGEEYLVKNNTLPEIDLYKAGHHGSKTSSSELLIETIKPKTICVCCCAGSPEYTDYPESQFPTQTFIGNIVKYSPKAEIYVTTMCIDYKKDEFTSLNGNIVYMVSPSGYEVRCSNSPLTLKESEWFKNNRVWKASPSKQET